MSNPNPESSLSTTRYEQMTDELSLDFDSPRAFLRRASGGSPGHRHELDNNGTVEDEKEWELFFHLWTIAKKMSPTRFRVRHHLFSTIFLQGLTLLMLHLTLGDEFKFNDVSEYRHVGGLFLCFVLQLLQIAVDLFSFVNLLRRLHGHKSLSAVWLMYVTFAFGFAGRDLVLHIYNDHSFVTSYNSHWQNENKSVFELWILFLYFSIATQTAVGFGDVAPQYWLAQVMSGFQMVLRLLFEVFIIGKMLSKISIGGDALISGYGEQLGFFGSINKIWWLRTIRRKARTYLLLTTAISQAIIALIVYLYAADEDGADSIFISAFLVVAQFMQCMLIVSVSLKFVTKAHRVTVTFLVQSYLSACLCFTGCYLVIYYVIGRANGDYNIPPILFYERLKADEKVQQLDFGAVVFKLIYFSLVCMTTTGYGLMKPQHWFAQIIVCSHMLCSVLYTVVIFGVGLSKYFQALDREDVNESNGVGIRSPVGSPRRQILASSENSNFRESLQSLREVQLDQRRHVPPNEDDGDEV
eukprot:g3228.t1